MSELVVRSVVLVFIASATNMVLATPQHLLNHKEYKENVALLHKIGREGLIKLVVKMQRDQIRDYGGSIDEYSEVISIFGDSYGFVQIMQIAADKFLIDLNAALVSEGKSKMSKDTIFTLWEEGKWFYNAQIKMLCTQPSTRAVIDNGISYKTKYYDQEMTYISEIIIDKAVCFKAD